MSRNEKKNIDERLKYLRLMRGRYTKAGPREKGRLLDEMGAVTAPIAKVLVRSMNGKLQQQARAGGRACMSCRDG